jgi:putative CRISPR-associated protein (TIGR02619 family)
MNKIYLISTVGISLLRNSLPGAEGAGLFKIANLEEADMDAGALSLVRRGEAVARKALEDPGRDELKRFSAELNGILSYEDEFDEKPLMHHVLVVTDTFVGQTAAAILSSWLQENRQSAETWVIKDLRTAEGAELRTALSGIVPVLMERTENASREGWHVVFNLTGGFKGVNGFLQTAAMLWADETIYVFEGSKELMHIPRLPIQVDTGQITGKQFDMFRKLGFGDEVDADDARKAGIAGSLLFELGGKAVLSEWGKLVWEDVHRKVSAQKLLEPMHPDIIFSDKFRHSVKGIAPDRMRLVNKALTAFAKSLNGEPEGNLNSLDFHPVRGKGKFLSTHQIDAWSDKDARRIFMHEQDGRWIMDELGLHL